MSKPVFYTFGGSVWAAAPELAIRELGYSPDAIDVKVVNLLEAKNFEPSFLKINEGGTLPTLTVGSKTYKSTAEVISYLIANAPKPAGKTSGTDLIEKVHDEKVDPNFAFLLTRNDQELEAKIGGKQGAPYLYVTNRQRKLKDIVNFEGANIHATFYQAKQAGDAPASSQAHWANLRKFILELPSYIPESGFIGGEKPGEDDFHLAAWLARIVATTGGSDIQALASDSALGEPVPVRLVTYWKTWSARESWKVVYADGLH